MEKVAIGVDLVRDADQVVVHVPEVIALGWLEPGQRRDVIDRAGKEVPLWGDDPAQRDQVALQAEDRLKLLVGGLEHDLVLDHVDRLVHARQDREERVGQGVEDLVEDELLAVVGMLLESAAQLLELRAWRAMDRDHVRAAQEHVQLGEDDLILLVARAVEDHERVFIEALELRTLVELLVVLDREGVKPEELPQGIEVVGARCLEVEPEELVAPQEVLDLRAVKRRQFAHGSTLPSAEDSPWKRKRRGCPGRSSAPPVVLRPTPRCLLGSVRLI